MVCAVLHPPATLPRVAEFNPRRPATVVRTVVASMTPSSAARSTNHDRRRHRIQNALGFGFSEKDPPTLRLDAKRAEILAVAGSSVPKQMAVKPSS